jgi:ubiquinone/menaquinone biosynthesis C-methylase UbiE
MNGKPAQPIFNLLCDTYDNIQTIKDPARRLVINAGLTPGQCVLDVACGTGWAAMAAAKAVGNNGRVIGIDIADKLLELALDKATSAELSNVEYHVGDATALEFDDTSFDVVLCASSIFLLGDIPEALQEWRRVLKNGGKIAFSSFGPGLLHPFIRLFFDRLVKYDGIAPPGQGLDEKVDAPEKCHELLEQAGFEEINIISEQLGFYLSDTTAYWRELSSMIVRLRLERLSPADHQNFKSEHLAEVESQRTEQGIWLDVPVHFSIARKTH